MLALGTVAGTTLGKLPGGISYSPQSFVSNAVQLEEGLGATTCLSIGMLADGPGVPAGGGSCSLDALGAKLDQVPGGPESSTTVTLTNVGDVVTTSSSLAAGTCKAGPASNAGGYAGSDVTGFCKRVDVTIADSAPGALDKCIFPHVTTAPCPAPGAGGTLASLAGKTLMNPGLSNLGPGASVTYEFTVQLNGSATNADQGLAATVPLTWTVN
jgi:hypothetical protein